MIHNTPQQQLQPPSFQDAFLSKQQLTTASFNSQNVQ